MNSPLAQRTPSFFIAIGLVDGDSYGTPPKQFLISFVVIIIIDLTVEFPYDFITLAKIWYI